MENEGEGDPYLGQATIQKVKRNSKDVYVVVGWQGYSKYSLPIHTFDEHYYINGNNC